jgi:hypothetical protein
MEVVRGCTCDARVSNLRACVCAFVSVCTRVCLHASVYSYVYVICVCVCVCLCVCL